MGETCKDCSKWAEDIFWTHFQNIHFSQILLDGFDQQLAIPKKFVENLRQKLPESVVLKGPSGVTWNVGLTNDDDTLFFKHGWEEFVKVHSLEENDFLVFRYNGVSQFDVLVFDGRNLCEKATSYFVRPCVHKNHENGFLAKRKLREGPLNEVHTPSNDCTSLEKSIDDESITVPSEEHIIFSSPATDKSTPVKPWSVRPIRARRLAGKQPATCSGVKSTPRVDKHTSTKKNEKYWLEYVSNRRPVTEEEIENAVRLAQAESSDESLMVVMRPTHVYKRFFVFIPLEWLMNHLSMENQDLYLRVNNNTWRSRYNYNQVRKYGGLCGGWKHFAVDNNLEEFDVCLFKPAGQMNKSILLDVSIFRVVEEVNLLTPVISITPKRARRKLIEGIQA